MTRCEYEEAVARGDVMPARIGTSVRSCTGPRLGFWIDRDADAIHGRGPANATVDSTSKKFRDARNLLRRPPAELTKCTKRTMIGLRELDHLRGFVTFVLKFGRTSMNVAIALKPNTKARKTRRSQS